MCVLAHFALDLWQPANAAVEVARKCVSIDLVAVAGIVFVVSTMILSEGRKAGLRLGLILSIASVVCINMVIAHLKLPWVLGAAVATRQVLGIVLAARSRPNRNIVASIVIAICFLVGSWIALALVGGHPEVVVYGLLMEIFLVAAVDFWSNNWAWTAGLNTMGFGLVAWASVYPMAWLARQLWPQFAIENLFWNIPKLGVVMGMILVVLEEDTRKALNLRDEYRFLFETNPNPMWVTDRQTLRFLNVNQAALDLHGYTREEFLALRIPDILIPGLVPALEADFLRPEPSKSRASRHIRKDGSEFPVDIAAYNLEFQGKPCRLVVGIDVTEREALTRQLAHQAQHDALTGLPNRVLFQDQLAEVLQQTAKSNEKLAVLCMDVTRLKTINDTFGLRIGDECIKNVAGVLGQHLRGIDDFVARMGGAQFAVALAGLKNVTAAEQVANELREAFAQPLLIQGYKIQISFSMGVTVFPDDGTDATTLWRRAESAQRQSRANGGDPVWFSPELNRAAEEQIELETFMRTELGRSGFRMVYQPIYGFDGTVHALEALLRLDHPKYGAVSPARFIPVAEETGLIIQIGYWVLEEVCRQINRWREMDVPVVPVAVNVSGMQLMHIDFAEQAMETLLGHGIDTKWIHLEVTETAAMHDPIAVCERMTALAALGIQFSIDDFGTGHSSLGRLHLLPISVLKVDRSFVDQLCEKNGTFSIVQAVISMAHALGHRVVAEGVEKPSQLACLHTLGCDLLQGFLLSKPAEPERIPELIQSTLSSVLQVVDTTQGNEHDWRL